MIYVLPLRSACTDPELPHAEAWSRPALEPGYWLFY